MSSYRLSNTDASKLICICKEKRGKNMKRTSKIRKRYIGSSFPAKETAAVVLAAGVIVTAVGCEDQEAYLIPTSSETVVTEVIETTDSTTATEATEQTTVAEPTTSSEETTPVEETEADVTPTETSETTVANNGKNTGSGPGSVSGNNTNSNSNPKATNTPKPTNTPRPTPNPYKEVCFCPDCGDEVRYHSATTKHHDAKTHEEKYVTYDKEIKTFQYTINWTGNFKNWCSENEVSVPSAPSAKGDVVYDNKGNVIDKSGEKKAINKIVSEADSLAKNLGYDEVAYSYKTKEVNKEYVNRVEHTDTIVDKEAWDEKIPAGWYCDRCDYYSASVPKEYDIGR